MVVIEVAFGDNVNYAQPIRFTERPASQRLATSPQDASAPISKPSLGNLTLNASVPPT
jgi:hypothetical protein